MLIELCPVEHRERPVVAREVGRHPVEQHADPVLMHSVDERSEVIGLAEARRRSVVAGDLVSPRAREGMLHHRHQLDVREPEIRDIVGELVRQLQVVERAIAVERVAAPRAEMNLVDRHRRAQRVTLRAALEPFGVGPFVARPIHDRRVCRRHLRVERHRVGLDAQPVLLRPDLELVLRVVAEVGDEELPDA
jgi:hypothetical protein